MEFQKKVEVQYKDGSKIMHTFEVLGGQDRNNIFAEYLNIKSFMDKGSKDNVNPMEFIKEDKNILDFTVAVLKAGCPTLEVNKVPAFICDKLFEELNDFLLSGGLKN